MVAPRPLDLLPRAAEQLQLPEDARIQIGIEERRGSQTAHGSRREQDMSPVDLIAQENR